jgi:hypothetical protein
VKDDSRYGSFEAFWPRYVRDHSLPATRRLHCVGLVLAAPAFLAGLGHDWRFLLLVPVIGYGFAWYGHFFIERNRPATFEYPLWSLMGDLRMFWLMLRGRMVAEVEQHGRTAGPPPVERARV